MSRIYLYLVRRDKKGLQVVSVLQGEHTHPVRLNEVKLLNLPRHMEVEISRVIHHNRMHWEPWLESAESYEALKKSVRGRGYTDVPVHSTPLCQLSLHQPVVSPEQQPANTMLRRVKTDA